MGARLVLSSRCAISWVVVAVPLIAAGQTARPRPAAPADGALLEAVDRENRLIAEQVRAEVENQLRLAREQMAHDPAAAEQQLKLLVERVLRTPRLSAEVRGQLRGQVAAAAREAGRRAAARDVTDVQAGEARAAAAERQRVSGELARRQERVRQLMDRFTSLMDEDRWEAAHRIASDPPRRAAADSPLADTARLTALQAGAARENLAQRTARQRGVVATLASVEVALMPAPDDQPFVYPDAEVWRQMTERRAKYPLADLHTSRPAEAKIRRELSEPTTMDFVDAPLADAVDYLKDLHGIEIQLDRKALSEAGMNSDTPITAKLKGISLRSGLRLMLRELDLTYIIKDEVLLITTVDRAAGETTTRAYDVADLVVPILPSRRGGSPTGFPSSIGSPGGTNQSPQGGPGMGPMGFPGNGPPQ